MRPTGCLGKRWRHARVAVGRMQLQQSPESRTVQQGVCDGQVLLGKNAHVREVGEEDRRIGWWNEWGAPQEVPSWLGTMCREDTPPPTPSPSNQSPWSDYLEWCRCRYVCMHLGCARLGMRPHIELRVCVGVGARAADS